MGNGAMLLVRVMAAAASPPATMFARTSQPSLKGDDLLAPRPGRPGHIGPSECRVLCRARCTPVLNLPFHGLYTVRLYHCIISSAAHCKLMTLGALKGKVI